jgi:uncharacterized protein YeaO (DUF488 family)
MQFTDLLDDYLAQKEVVDKLREKYNQNPESYKESFTNYYYEPTEKYQQARNRLNEFMTRKPLSEIRFGRGL